MVNRLYCLLASLIALPGLAADISIALRDHAMLESRDYSLGEIADLQCTRLAACTSLRALKVGVSPRPGYTDTISQATLARLVRSRLPAYADQVAWTGRNSVQLEASTVLIDEQLVMQTAQAALTNWLTAQGGELQLEVLTQATPVSIPKGALTLHAGKITPERPQARMTVWLDIYLDGQFYRSLSVPFRVALQQSVLLPRTTVAKGQPIDCQLFDKQLQEVTGLPSAALLSCPAGARTRSTLAAGKPVLQEQLETMPAVVQGETATLSMAVGNVHLESSAAALSDGRIGDIITVKPTYGTETIQARVIAPGQLVTTER